MQASEVDLVGTLEQAAGVRVQVRVQVRVRVQEETRRISRQDTTKGSGQSRAEVTRAAAGSRSKLR